MVVSAPCVAGLALSLVLLQLQGAALPGAEDPRVRRVVERFFAAQEAEDVDAYLTLWSAKAQSPRREQLDFIFKAGDDRFSDIVINRVTRVGDLLRVAVTVRRERTSAAPRPGGSLAVSTAVRAWSLTLVEEGDELKILSEGFPADDLAVALVAAPTLEARQALMDAEPDALTDRLIQALSMRADSLAQTGQYAGSRAIYERVLEVARRLGNRKAEGEALQNIGNSYYFQSDFPAALRVYEERLALERDAGNEPGVAGAILGVATIKYSSFEYGDALVAYREALTLYEILHDEAGMATALLSTGNVLYLQGDLEGAITDYRRSRDLYRGTHNTDGEARALAGLGRVHVSQGDFAAALDAFAGVQEEGRARGNRVLQANALHSIGEVHLRLGNPGTARTAFDGSRQHFEAAGDGARVGQAWQGIALADLTAARFAPAEQAYGRSMAACAGAGDRDCVARAIIGLAYAQFSQDHHDDAIASYRKAIDAFTALDKPAEIGRAEVGLSQSLFAKQEFEAAATAAVSARDRAPVFDLIWRAHLAEARARRALGQPEGAMNAALAALEVVEAVARASLERPAQRVAADSAAVYAFLAVLQAEAGDAAGAFDTVERRHAHSLRVALSNNERDIVRHMPDGERDAERLAAARVGSLHAQIEKEQGLPKSDLERIARLEEALHEAVAVRAAEREGMFERWPELRIWRGLAPPVTTSDVAPLITAEELSIVQFVLDQDDLLVLTAAPDDDADVRFRAHLVRVSRQDLAELVAAAISPAVLRNEEAWRKAVAPFAGVLPADARAVLASARRVLVVPDDVLWRVPFEALPVGKGYLSDTVELAYAGSMTAVLRAREAAGSARREPSDTPLLAAGAPAIPEARLEAVQITAPDWQPRDPGASAREIRRVAERFTDPPASMLMGPEATEQGFRDRASSARLIQVAGPFRVSSASPLFSSVLWSLPEPAKPPADGAADAATPSPVDSANDGVLEAREVMNLDLRADVVVLSDGAATAMRDAAGAIGVVQWAWRASGVPAVMIRRWPDDHVSADDLLAEFHARVHEGQPPSAALHAARAVVRAAEATRAPWFWASWFVVR